MLQNLRAEMARKNITIIAIGKAIGRTPRSVSDKIKGKYDFTLPELKLIRDEFFPECDLEYLSANEKEVRNVQN